MIYKSLIFNFFKQLKDCYLNRNTFYFGNHLKYIAIVSGVLFIFIFDQCKKDPVNFTPLNLDVIFLGHKGGGNSTFNDYYIENTLPSIKYGLEAMNGIEVDVQMSLDGTLWIYHNPDFMRTCCIPNYSHALVLLNDTDIGKLQICDGTISDRVYKLEEMFNFWRDQTKRFPFSLHLKVDQTADTLNSPLIGGKAAYLSKFADSLAKIFPPLSSSDLAMIEIYDAAFLKKIKLLIPGLKVCCDKEGNFTILVDTAVKSGYHGISASFDADGISVSEVKRARDNGLIVQLWTPDLKQELIDSYLLKPNFIQTNNMYGAIICQPYNNPSGN